MNSKVLKKLNLGASIFFGLSTLFASLCGVIGFFIWLHRVWTDQARFSWVGFCGILILSLILFIIGIVMMKSGIDEMKKS